MRESTDWAARSFESVAEDRQNSLRRRRKSDPIVPLWHLFADDGKQVRARE